MSFSPSISQIASVMAIDIFGLCCFSAIFYSCFKLDSKIDKIELEKPYLCIALLTLLTILIGICLYIKLFLFVLLVVTAITLGVGFDAYKNGKANKILISILILATEVIILTTIIFSSIFVADKTEYLKLKNENYLLVLSAPDRDIYKEYDFENATFTDNFKFLSTGDEVQLELVSIKQ